MICFHPGSTFNCELVVWLDHSSAALVCSFDRHKHTRGLLPFLCNVRNWQRKEKHEGWFVQLPRDTLVLTHTNLLWPNFRRPFSAGRKSRSSVSAEPPHPYTRMNTHMPFSLFMLWLLLTLSLRGIWNLFCDIWYQPSQTWAEHTPPPWSIQDKE